MQTLNNIFRLVGSACSWWFMELHALQSFFFFFSVKVNKFWWAFSLLMIFYSIPTLVSNALLFANKGVYNSPIAFKIVLQFNCIVKRTNTRQMWKYTSTYLRNQTADRSKPDRSFNKLKLEQKRIFNYKVLNEKIIENCQFILCK